MDKDQYYQLCWWTKTYYFYQTIKIAETLQTTKVKMIVKVSLDTKYFVLDCETILNVTNEILCNIMTQFITVTSKWARWRPKSQASRVFTQPLTQV